MVKHLIAMAFAAIMLAQPCQAANPGSAAAQSDPTACAQLTPYGQPSATDGRAPLAVICHTAYVTALNTHREVPDWVGWTLSPEHAIGCAARSNAFQADPAAPAGFAVAPRDYLNYPFDKGHFAPDRDFAWSDVAERESFYMTNMSPQAKKLNEQGWEEAEAKTRAWAWSGKYGTLAILDGPLYGHHPEKIGVQHQVSVPAAYWKIVVSPSAGLALAYIMPNLPVTKQREGLRLVAIADIERLSGLSIPLPANFDRVHVALEWPADLSGYAKAAKAKCG